MLGRDMKRQAVDAFIAQTGAEEKTAIRYLKAERWDIECSIFRYRIDLVQAAKQLIEYYKR